MLKKRYKCLKKIILYIQLTYGFKWWWYLEYAQYNSNFIQNTSEKSKQKFSIRYLPC